MPAIPSKLYKYRRLDEAGHTEAIFQYDQLYFSAPYQFNDPFDCGMHVLVEGERNQLVIESVAFTLVESQHPHLSAEEKREVAQNVGRHIVTNETEQARSRLLEMLVAETNDVVGILSLTEKHDDILMWSHYADQHRGICLEFDPSLCALLRGARHVEYTHSYPIVNSYDAVVDEQFRRLAPWMLTKSKAWQYEQEWRVLDFDRGKGARAFSRNALTAVILGCRISNASREQVVTWISSRETRPHLYQAKQSRSEFRLIIEQIEI